MQRIRNEAIGVNFIDTYHRSGLYGNRIQYPFTLGVEGAGVVVDAGPESAFKEGDRVSASILEDTVGAAQPFYFKARLQFTHRFR